VFTVDHSTEVALMSLFTDPLLREFTKFLGLDPALKREHQPVDPEDLLHECVGLVERHQGRNILQKTVTLKLDYTEFTCASDYRVYLPYGEVPSLTTFTYRKTDETNEDISAADFELSSTYPAFLWSNTWSSIFSDPDSDYKEGVTLTWTAGYSSIAELPSSTWKAIRIMGRYLLDSRGEDMPIPQSFNAFAGHDALEDRRVKRYLT